MNHSRVIKTLDNSGIEYTLHKYESDFIDTQQSAQLIGVDLHHIVKTLVFRMPIGINVIMLAGDSRINSNKYKQLFKVDMHILDKEDLKDYLGCEPGAVSPVGIKYKKAKVYMDESLKDIDGLVYPSAGTLNSAISIAVDDLFTVCKCKSWIDISQ